MITATGAVKLTETALVSYNSPLITVTGQSTSTDTSGLVNLTLEVRSPDMSERILENLSIPTGTVRDMMLANSVDGASFVENLYSMLESLLRVYLENINQSATFVLS